MYVSLGIISGDLIDFYSSKRNFQIRFHATLDMSQCVAKMALNLLGLFRLFKIWQLFLDFCNQLKFRSLNILQFKIVIILPDSTLRQ